VIDGLALIITICAGVCCSFSRNYPK